MIKEPLTQEKLKSLLNYDLETGIFTWKVSPRINVCSGNVAGTLHQGGYIIIMINLKRYRAHRLAFLYMEGYLPSKDIDVDHINGIRSDNAWKNLRKATRSQNTCNRNFASRKISTKVQFRGLREVKRKKSVVWEVSVVKNGKQHHGGTFKVKNDAVIAARELRKKLHGEFFSEDCSLSGAHHDL